MARAIVLLTLVFLPVAGCRSTNKSSIEPETQPAASQPAADDDAAGWKQSDPGFDDKADVLKSVAGTWAEVKAVPDRDERGPYRTVLTIVEKGKVRVALFRPATMQFDADSVQENTIVLFQHGLTRRWYAGLGGVLVARDGGRLFLQGPGLPAYFEPFKPAVPATNPADSGK